MIGCVVGESNRPITAVRCCDCCFTLSKESPKCNCESCGRMTCDKCMHVYQCVVSAPSNGLDAASETEEIRRCCKFCIEMNLTSNSKSGGKVHPSASSQQSCELPSPSCSGDQEKASGTVRHDYLRSPGVCAVLAPKNHTYSPDNMTCSTFASCSGHTLPVSAQSSSSRSDEDEAEHYHELFSPSSCQDLSDLDSNSFFCMHEQYTNSVGSSPIDSLSSNYFSCNRLKQSLQTEGPVDESKRAAITRFKLEIAHSEDTNESSSDHVIMQQEQKPLDFDNNGLIWYPPPPEDENHDSENNFFTYDDEDDNIGEAGAIFSSSSHRENIFQASDRHSNESKETGVAVWDHFRALVANLLQGEGFIVRKENSDGDWLDVVSNLAWRAANFVKPDTSRGGSMDPIDYVKIKCAATGNPNDSALIKGVVCTKNIKHKRMTSQYKNARLLLLGGALEYQRVQNQLASMDTLLQQEIDHLKLIVSKIEAHRPNVLLVEKSVSSYAQEYLLEKDISLVLNVKRPLLERIAQCSGALITQSLETISSAQLGHCELFHLERVFEEHGNSNQLNKKMTKTLMFFEGCTRRLGCTVLLKGTSREELKKVKHVVQYALFAAYHLSLETSFLADEGASIPKMAPYPALAVPERLNLDNSISNVSTSAPDQHVEPSFSRSEETTSSGTEIKNWNTFSENDQHDFPFSPCFSDSGSRHQTDSFNKDLMVSVGHKLYDWKTADVLCCNSPTRAQNTEIPELSSPENLQENDKIHTIVSTTESQQSILVSFSSCCVPKETLCERSRLMRITFYGCFDKPLGRYLRDDLFGQTSYCQSCEEPAEDHVQCFTHQLGSLIISVKQLPNIKLSGEQDEKIWMWHRCLKCAHVDGIPPATRRVIMSDAAWGLSFGKFLELSFSNHATANRVATCGHSLQRDCLRYYGLGNMVAFFRYSPIEILSVHLPPSIIEFDNHIQDEWIQKQAAELLSKSETLYAEISNVLHSIEHKSISGRDPSVANELLGHVMELKDLAENEKEHYKEVLEPATLDVSQSNQLAIDILELNGLRRSLLIGSHVWDRRLYALDSLINTVTTYSKASLGESLSIELNDNTNGELHQRNLRLESRFKENISVSSNLEDFMTEESLLDKKEQSEESTIDIAAVEVPMLASDCNEKECGHAADGQVIETNLSDKIDSAWAGTDPVENPTDELPSNLVGQQKVDSPPRRRLTAPLRVYSFDSANRVNERIQRESPPSPLHLSTLRSFHGSGDYRSMVKDPSSNIRRTLSQFLPQEARDMNMNNILKLTPSLISSANHIAEGARLLLPQTGEGNIAVAVYDSELTSIISYALSCREYENWISDKPSKNEAAVSVSDSNKEGSLASTLSSWQSFGSLNLDYIQYKSYGSEDLSSSIGSLFTDSKKSLHLRLCFKDESLTAGSRAKFSVTCYFAKQFEALRRKCCPSEVDFVRSLSRCSTWSAQGGKSNVFFAKTLDERFIIKQVTKTELDSFEEFAPEYFKYLAVSISSGSPTCLAKILGLYQVTAKNSNGGKVTKMDVMVMENLFYKRKVSRVYDLKGSSRSRYNADTTGENKVLLDTNLLETLRTDPIFLGSKAKRSLERAVWNDTSFLASVDVMDYSLLVGVDNERNELVLGIIDYMRQYTWDKHLETWVKASGILGGPKNAAPTIISPKQYKRRFRKAMTTYFLTVPDQWPS